MVCSRHHGKEMFVSGSTNLHMGIGLAKMQDVWWNLMSMADELPGMPNRGSCTINFSASFRHVPR